MNKASSSLPLLFSSCTAHPSFNKPARTPPPAVSLPLLPSFSSVSMVIFLPFAASSVFCCRCLGHSTTIRLLSAGVRRNEQNRATEHAPPRTHCSIITQCAVTSTNIKQQKRRRRCRRRRAPQSPPPDCSTTPPAVCMHRKPPSCSFTPAGLRRLRTVQHLFTHRLCTHIQIPSLWPALRIRNR